MMVQNWIAEEFDRANDRTSQLPPYAKMIVTKPLTAGQTPVAGGPTEARSDATTAPDRPDA
jgi:hypothetical protein